jgi:DNA-directed DNA polymerase III PolC
VVIGDRPLTQLTPALQGSALGPAGHPVQHEVGRERRPGEVRLPGPEDPDGAGPRGEAPEEARHGGRPRRLPFDDTKTYELLASGQTVGVFQLESQGMRDTLRKMRCGSIEEITALISLYRPGPMDNIDTFVDCKFGRKPVDTLHPSLETVLKETYGVIVYQEQVMQIAQILAGYSLGEADLLRRAMGKKKKEEMDLQKIRFVSGAKDKGVPEEQSGSIFELVAKFAGYGFNKSHAAAYALISYQTAWLKANTPVEFLAASMSLDISNTDKLAVFHQDARRFDITVRAPDVNRSGADFEVENGEVLYALGAVRNVGLEAMKHLVAVREEGGPFRDIFDFVERIDPKQVNKRAIENLARAGAFDSFHKNRAQIVASADVSDRPRPEHRRRPPRRAGRAVRRRSGRRPAASEEDRELEPGRPAGRGTGRCRLLPDRSPAGRHGRHAAPQTARPC